MVDTLDKELIAGVGLDVYREEPYKGPLLHYDNVITTSVTYVSYDIHTIIHSRVFTFPTQGRRKQMFTRWPVIVNSYTI